MKNIFVLFLVSAWLLAGCASVATPPPATGTTVPPGVQPPGGGIAIAPVPQTAMSSNKAVIALLDQAQIDNGAGHREAADALLERALNIEPRNPWLWHQLAQLRLDQGQYAQAITLAGKSNSFAGSQNDVQAANWQVIGQARVAQGDPAGAEQAFKHAADLTQQDKTNQGSLFNLP